MPPQSNQLTLPFGKLTEKNLQSIVKKFKKAGYTVTAIDAPNVAKRESGFLIKNFTLTFEDGQQIQVRVKADGTIFQVKLNRKVVPVRNVDNMDKAVVEMADYMYYNAKAFARAKAQRERRKLNPPKPSVTTTRAEKLAQATENLGILSENVEDLEKQFAEIMETVAFRQSSLERAQSELNAELARTKRLEGEVAELQAHGA